MPDYLRHLFSAPVAFCCVAMVAVALLAATSTEAASPLLQAEPTADPCAPATLTPAGNIVNVRAAPGSNNELLNQLRTGEVRSVLGRHWRFRWWQIEMSNGSEGWVWDGAVELSGNIAAVPVITLPADDDQPAEATWEPTVDVACVATPVTNTDGVLTTPTPPAGAVAEELNANDDGWSAPINLSRSGLATEPQMVVDGEGNAHVLWQEQGMDGFLYTRQLDGAWLPPAIVEVPFGTRQYTPDLQPENPTPLFTPVLVAGGTGIIHTLWRDSGGALQYSNVEAESFDTFQAWSAPETLAETALGTVATTDEGGRIHVSYIRPAETEDAPAGVYYQQSEDGGESWTEPVALYTSGYMRAVAADNARVQIAATGSGSSARVYVAWDNPSLEKVFLARSINGGASWLEPSLVDARQPDDRSEAVGPSKVMLTARDAELLVLWQAGHKSENCQQYYQYSDDSGVSWTQAGVLLEEFSTCPTNQQLLAGRPETTLFLAKVDSRAYLLAWDGEQWSEPQQQELLAAFTNPETLRLVDYGCQRSALVEPDKLMVAGCSEGAEQDIWVTARDLESVDGWFGSSSPWRDPATVLEETQELNAVELLPAGSNQVHAFWSQATGRSVYYAQWNGNGRQWTRPLPVVSAPEGYAGPPSVAAGPNDRLFVSWHSGDGNIYFSTANSGQALTGADWSVPKPLPLPGDTRAILPDIVAAEDRLLAAYTVPLNEYRGVYLTTSTDMGATWTDPVFVFDGVAAGWQIVGGAAIAVSDNGVVHALAVDETVGVGGTLETQALHYSRSEDGGQTFSSAEEVFAGSIPWHRIVVLPGGLIHRLWQEDAGTASALWHQVSRDNGKSWELAQRLLVQPGASMVAADGGRSLHLLHGTLELLQHWVWDGDRWNSAESLDWHKLVSPLSSPDRGTGAAAITREGHLLALYDVPAKAGSESGLAQLIFTERAIELSEPLPTLVPAATATALPDVTPTAAATMVESANNGLRPANASDTEATTGSNAADSDPIMQIALAIIPAGLLVIIVGLLRVRLSRSDRRRS